MIYLSGSPHPGVLRVSNTGYMLTMQMANRPDLESVWWAADTGCYSVPETYTTERYARWLSSMAAYRRSCLFVTAPDAFGDGEATLRLARPVLPIIRALGYPAALVIQPGITLDEMPWDDIDAVFTGGPDWWQTSRECWRIVDAGRQRGKWTHRGRVNSLRRLRASAVGGYDSADGTFVAFGGDLNVDRVHRWMDALNGQKRMAMA